MTVFLCVSGFDDNMSECSFGSRADLDRLLDGPVPAWVVEGEGVTATSSSGPSKSGVVRFVGPVLFAPGNWVGVELDHPEGEGITFVSLCAFFHGYIVVIVAIIIVVVIIIFIVIIVVITISVILVIVISSLLYSFWQ